MLRGPLLAAAALALALLAGCGSGEASNPGPAPPTEDRGAEASDGSAAERLGFPGFATKNTTRVGGADPAANAAGVALAVHPSAGGVSRPDVVTLVDSEDWHGGLAAAALVGGEAGSPILLTQEGSIPAATQEALAQLRPEGSRVLSRRGASRPQILRVGAATAPEGLRVREIDAEEDSPAALAAAIDEVVADASGRRSERVIVVPQDDPAFAAPAAAWAAISGEAILFTGRENVPRATLEALSERRRARVTVLGPPSAVSNSVIRSLRGADGVSRVRRVAGEDPVENAIAFARHSEDGWGWNINDPGHGLVVARADRPMDAVAATPLTARGKPGPLLLTDQAGRLPAPLESFLLDIRPGFRDDPTRAVYNHVWLIGDREAISLGTQALIDELCEIVEIRPEAAEGPDEETDDDPAEAPDRRPPVDDETPAEQEERGAEDAVPSDEELLEELDDALGRSPRRGSD